MYPPRKNPTDADKYRQQYLNALRLQASNNQLNANANMILKQTGATPTKPTDFRTTTERYADLEGMRILLETELRSLTDGTSASQISHELTPVELKFALHAFPTIKEYFSTKYALGVPAPVAVNYIRRLLAKERITQGVEFGLQQGTGVDILLSSQQILNHMPSYAQIDELLQFIRRFNTPASSSVASDLMSIRSMLPTESDLSHLDSLNAEESDPIFRELDELLESIPTNEQFEAFRRSLDIASSDPRATERELMSMDEQLRQDPQAVQDGIQLINLIRSSRSEPEDEQMSEISAETTAPAVSSVALTDWTNGSGNPAFSVVRKQQILQTWLDSNREAVLTDSRGKNYHYGDKLPRTHSQLDTLHSYAVAQSQGGTPMTPVPQGRGIKGMGFAKATRQRVRKDRLKNLIEGEVEKPKPFIPFGRFVIHRYDLDSGKLNMKTPKGGVINKIPSQKISQGLASVLKTIGKGILPDYDKVNGLRDEDKETLHKVITHSRLTDKVSVPTPKSKTEEEQMADRFDILKGEIVAGNDNPKIVKELKMLLMKLINTGRIPRKEAHDILTDLASIGI